MRPRRYAWALARGRQARRGHRSVMAGAWMTGAWMAGCGGAPAVQPVAEPFVVEVEDVAVAPAPIPERAERPITAVPTPPREPEPSGMERKRAAVEAYKQGRKLMTDGDYRRAAERFGRADALFPGASPKYHRALCLDRMGARRQAIEAYKRFIDSDPSAKYHDRVLESEKRITELHRGVP